MISFLWFVSLALAVPEPPETIVPYGSNWLLWISPTIPPNWPNEPTSRSGSAFQYAPTRAQDIRLDLRCPANKQPCDGDYRAVDVWLNGLKAPFLGVVENTLDELLAHRTTQYRRHQRHKSPYQPSTIIAYSSSDLPPEIGLMQIYMVNEFEVSDPEKYRSMHLNIAIQQGALIYLNGTEIGRKHISPGGERHNSYARIPKNELNMATKIDGLDYQYHRLRDIDVNLLKPGTNVLSMVIKKSPETTFPGLYADAELLGYGEVTLLKKPYVQHLDTNGFMVSFESSAPCSGAVEIKTVDSRQTLVYNGSTNKSFQHVSVDGLLPNTVVDYRVRCMTDREVLYSDWYSIKTAPDSSVDFSFMLYGDSRSGDEKHKLVVEQMRIAQKNDPASFVVHTGDMVTNGYEEWRWQSKFFDPIDDMLAVLPIFPSPGNHELNQHQYTNYFKPPEKSTYYSFQHGNTEFFSIDSNIDFKTGSQQHQWLKDALSRSAAQWKIAFFHHPAFSCAVMRKPGDVNVRNYLVPLFEEHGVQLVLLGHDHLYGKTRDVNGVRYLISGGGGSWLYDGRTDKYNTMCKKAYHFVQFWINNDEIRWTATDINGTVFDNDRIVNKSED